MHRLTVTRRVALKSGAGAALALALGPPRPVSAQSALPLITDKRSPWRITINGDTAWGIASTEYEGPVDGGDVSFVSTQLAVVTRGEDGKWLIRSIHWSSMPL